MGYKIAHALVKFLFSLFTHIKIIGRENAPISGSMIIVANHLGRLDVPLVYYFLNRQDVIVMVADKYKKNLFIHWLFNRLNGIWVDRYNADFGALRQSLSRLRKGGVLVLSPEGTRSATGALLEAKPGAAFLASKAGVPILPVALTGTEDRQVIRLISHFKRPHIVVRVGKPFNLPAVAAKDPGRDAIMGQYTDEIMCRIAGPAAGAKARFLYRSSEAAGIPGTSSG